MHKAQQQVLEFHKKFDHYVGSQPAIPVYDVRRLHEDLIKEEFQELRDAIIQRDLPEIADALGDLLYVVYGCAVAFGIDLEPISNIIHLSNMSKVGGGKTSTGKSQKPPGFVPPTQDIIEELKRQRCVV